MKHITRRMMIGLLAAAVLLAMFAGIPAYAQTGYTLQVTGGDNQSAPIATAFASPLRVTVTDGSGAGVAGVVVSLIIALVISQLAALWPARRAARIRIIEAIQFE